jgi:hypothetical protein
MHAKHFINKRMHSLEKDINHCVKTEPYAPFPALIYCFYNIESIFIWNISKYNNLLDTYLYTFAIVKKVCYLLFFWINPFYKTSIVQRTNII